MPLGAFDIGSCFKSALITRRCVNRQQAQSAKMTIRIIVPGFISTDLLSLHTRQRLVQQIFELDQLLLRKIDTSLHCLRNIKRPLFQCFTFFSQRKKEPALIVLRPDTVNISLFIEPLRERCQSSILCFSLCLVALYVSITVTTSKSQPQPAENQDFFCNPALFLCLYAQSFEGLNPTIANPDCFWVQPGFIVYLYQFASEWGSNHCINDIYESADFMAG